MMQIYFLKDWLDKCHIIVMQVLFEVFVGKATYHDADILFLEVFLW